MADTAKHGVPIACPPPIIILFLLARSYPKAREKLPSFQRGMKALSLDATPFPWLDEQCCWVVPQVGRQSVLS